MPGSDQRTDATTAGPIEPYLRDDERLCHLLTNKRVGVERGDGPAVRPGDDAGAYLGLTDRRILVLVVDPVDRDSDFVTAHRYTTVADVTVKRGDLIPCVEFDTEDGQTYSFTARESNVEAVGTFLSVSCEGQSASSTARTELADHCGALADHLAAGEWAAFDDRLSGAMEAVERLRDDPTSTPLPDGIVRDIHCLVRDRYVLAGRATLTSARRRLDAGDLEQSYRLARTAADRFEAALERARREELATENAVVGLTTADDIADTSLGRLFATGRHLLDGAADRPSPEERIDDFEAALDIYDTVGTLVSGDDTLSDRAGERARKSATTAIEGALDARLERARDHRQAADWERTVGHDTAARELAASARSDLDRALELATAYPPGDADAIRERRAELVAEFELSEE